MRTAILLTLIGSLCLPTVAAAQGTGTLRGTVTNSLTGAPIEGVRVSVVFGPGDDAAVFTNADGVYEVSVTAGSHDVLASKTGYVSTFYPDVECRMSCRHPGGAVVVTAGGVVTANVTLRPLAALSGILTDSATGLPIVSADVRISALNARGVFEGTVVSATDNAGRYTIHNLDPGAYRVTAVATGYVTERYDNLPCIAVDCGPLTGTQVTVAVGTPGPSVDFALDPAGTIAGTVRAATGGAPVAGAELTLYNMAGSQIGATTSGQSGAYTFTGVPAGDYFIRARPPDTRFVAQLFGGVPCRPMTGDSIGCRIADGTRVHVNTGATTSGVDFMLTSTGSIAGTVRASDGTPIDGAQIEAFEGSGVAQTSVSQQDGRFSLTGLAPGRYHLRASARGYASRTIDGSFTVSSGAEAPNADFTLTTGGAITGALRFSAADLSGGLGWRHGGGGTVVAYDSSGRFVRNARLTLSGTGASVTDVSYSVDGLPDGTYFLRYEVQASHSLSVWGYFTGLLVEQIYGAGSCVTIDCDVRRGAPVMVTGGATVGNIDFQLETGHTIFSVQPTDEVYDGRGVRVHERRFQPTVAFVAGRVMGLPAGTYYVRRPGGRLHAAIACADCPGIAGTPMVRPGPSETELAIPDGVRSISGAVRASAGGAPLSTITVTAYSESGTAEASTLTDLLGLYSITGLAPGRYFLKTSNDRGFVDKAYPDATCVDCDPRASTAVDVTSGDATGNDLALDAAALVAGTLADSQGVPLDSATVAFYDSAGAVAGRVRSRKTGGYTIQLPPGTYYARSEPAHGYASQLYSGAACPQGQCDPRAGAPITASIASPVTSIDFSLAACVAPSLSPGLLATGVEGVPYRQVFAASEGVPPYRYTIASGFLPLGLTLDPASGVLSGTPAGSGSHTITVAATGSSTNCAGTRTYTLHVSQCAFTVSPSSTTVGSGGATVAVTVTNACGDRTLTSTAPWLHPAFDPAGTSLSIDVDPNPASSKRTATVIVGRRLITIHQAGTASTAPFGVIDTPSDGQPVSGSVSVSGWALDDLGVTRVRITRDSVDGEPAGQVFIGNAVFVAGARPDVERIYSTFPSSARAGWGYLLLSNMLPNGGNGLFRLYAYADDGEGHSTLLGTRTIVGANAAATTPFGAIDTPAQGETIRGERYINWGWALTPHPKSIPVDGSTLQVIVDGVSVGNATYNLFRPDVAGLFPGLANSAGAIGYRVIDTTALAEGIHSIAWVVTDSAGAASGIGSRYFTVNNSADGMAASSTEIPGYAKALTSDSTAPPRFTAADRLEHIRLALAESDDASCPSTFEGYQVANEALHPLPAGSSLDRTGTFSWQPGPAFSGTYRLMFVRTACDGTRTRIPVSVTIR